MSNRPLFVTNEVRDARRERKIPDSAACALCGLTNKVMLTRSRKSLIIVLLEFHHGAGAANDPKMGGWLCLNHHREATELQRQAGVVLDHDESRHQLELYSSMLLSAGTFLSSIAEALIRAAEYLAAFVRTLDREQPKWRTLQVPDR